jgi:hypothetical protein
MVPDPSGRFYSLASLFRGACGSVRWKCILDQLLKGALPLPHFGPTLRMSLVEVDEGRVVFFR